MNPLAFLALLLQLAAPVGVVGSPVTDSDVRPLELLRERYAAIQSVHVRANVSVAIGNERRGAGSYEYWEAGPLYRINCRVDPKLDLLEDTDVSYDGKRFYFHNRLTDTLSYQAKDTRNNPSSLPNPFFLPLDFLVKPDCGDCPLRLSDIKDDALWARRRPAPKSGLAGSPGTKTFVIPGGGQGELPPFDYRLRLVGSAPASRRLTQIDRVAPEGRVLGSISLSGYQAGLPRRVSISDYDESGQLRMRAEFVMDVLEINRAMDPGIFTIDPNSASIVWDSDREQFVKQRREKVKM